MSECEYQKHKETIKNCARFVAGLLYRLFCTLEVYLIVVGGGWTLFMGGWRYILGGWGWANVFYGWLGVGGYIFIGGLGWVEACFGLAGLGGYFL